MGLIEINLLPIEKQKKLRKFPGVALVKSFLPLAIGIVAIVIIIHIFLSLAVFCYKGTYNKLSKKWEDLAPEKKQVDLLKNEAVRMEKKINIVEQLLAGRFSWAKKLQSLNESVVSGIWLNYFTLGEKIGPNTNDKVAFLSLSGSAIATAGQGTANIGKFMKNLKENHDFFDDFDEIELGTIQRKNIKETEIMDFTITAYFKKERIVF